MKNTLSCFSPAVMMTTFLLEIFLFAYVLLRYKLSRNIQLIAALLLFLGLFQLAEYGVCVGLFTLSGEAWSRIGFMSISMLPVLGLHLSLSIADKPRHWLLLPAYASLLSFTGLFMLSPDVFSGYACHGNYAIFQLTETAGSIYTLYYYLWLLVGVGVSLFYAGLLRKQTKTPQTKALTLQAVGYLSFMLPTAAITTVFPDAIHGVPSVMCGFALIYALILTFGISPKVGNKRDTELNAQP